MFCYFSFLFFFFNASILQASWSPTTTQESDVYTLQTGGGEAELSQPRAGEEEPRAWLHQHGNKQEHSVRCEHLTHTDTHSTFLEWERHLGSPRMGEAVLAPEQLAVALTSRLCWPQPPGAGQPRGSVVAQGDTSSSADPGQLTGKGKVSLKCTQALGQEGHSVACTGPPAPPSNSTHAPRAKLQPRVTP